MTGARQAFLFPAFSMKYRDFSRPPLDGYLEEVDRFLARASAVVGVDERKFERPADVVLDDPLQDDLQDHYISYVDGCALASLLNKRGAQADYVAGYSMGVFAALQHSGAVSFEDGLRLLHQVCVSAHQVAGPEPWGMGVIMGLTAEEVARLIDRTCPSLAVGDVCASRVVIASGRRQDLDRLFEAAEAAGSMRSRHLPVTLPFHSPFLRNAEGMIRGFLNKIDVRRPACGIVSAVDQQVLLTEDDVRTEAATNLWRPLRWHDTMRSLLAQGVRVFLESGLSDGLCNLSRSLDGDFQAYHPRKYDRFFGAVHAIPLS